MLSERQLDALMEAFTVRMQTVVDQYLQQVGEHLRDIGQLTPTDVHRLAELKRLNANTRRVKREIARAARLSVQDVEKVFQAVAESNEAFARQYYGSDQEAPNKGSAGHSAPIERILKAQLRITKQTMQNLSQTTIETGAYRRAIDVAVQTVQGGLADYNSAIRKAMIEVGGVGLRVKYPSGYSRRLDSAVRQNVLDGVRAVNNDTLRQLGKEFGADGVQISLHALCAEDHLPYQGRRFTNKQFERLQNRLPRPFGMWNCKHTMFPVLMSAPPTYSEEEIEQYRKNSAEKIEIDGRTLSRYEWTQEQRRIEAAIRQQKDIANLARASGDMKTARQASAAIDRLYARYDRISDAAGLDKQYARAYVRGYRETRGEKGQAAQSAQTARRQVIAEAPRTAQRSAPDAQTQPLQKQEEKRIIETDTAIVAAFFRKDANGGTARTQSPPVANAAPVASTKESGDGVNFICKLDRSIYSCVTEDITTDEVVITEERIQHIKDRHPNDYERYFRFMADMIVQPQYIIEDADLNTAFVLRQFEDENSQFRLILRLHTAADAKGRKNSVITFQYIKAKEFSRLIRNKKILYRAPDL